MVAPDTVNDVDNKNESSHKALTITTLSSDGIVTDAPESSTASLISMPVISTVGSSRITSNCGDVTVCMISSNSAGQPVRWRLDHRLARIIGILGYFSFTSTIFVTIDGIDTV